MPRRYAMWDRLGEPFDLVVTGGGITGCGIARDAARRGLRVALLEMRDVGYGTSSRSSKLVHGGLRYLEHYEFSLVFEAVSERRILLDIAPHLVNPLGFLFPVYEGARRGLWAVNAGMWIYEGLSLFRSPKRHRTLTPSELAVEEPELRQEGLTGAPLYYDGATDDARLTLENALDAIRAGAVVVTRARVVGFPKDERSGRVRGVLVEDAETGARREVPAPVIVNATGPWTDVTIAASGGLDGRPLLRPTKGVHVVVPHERLPLAHAVVCIHPADGRVLFAIPWGERTYVGTTDTDHAGDPADVYATAGDVRYLLEAANATFPRAALGPDDVVATWAGLRPLVGPSPAGAQVAESAVSREHRIVIGQDGLVTIAGGKLTTYRRMAAEVVDTAVQILRLSDHLAEAPPPARTDREPLPGAVGWPEDDDHDKVAEQVRRAGEGAVDGVTARLLADTYGTRALDVARRAAADPALAAPLVEGRPEILAQVDWAVDEELATTVEDVLVRRTQLYFRDRDQGLGAAPAVALRMAALLGWTDARRDEEIRAYAAEVARSRAWRRDYLQNEPSIPNTGSTGSPNP